MLFTAIFIFMLTIIVLIGSKIIYSSNEMETKEKRDSLLLIFGLFCLVVTLNEIQNIIPYKPN
jgi:hypothetical protein